MSIAPDLDNLKTISETIVFPPSDLLSDESQLESYFHLQQMVLLLNCLNWWWRDRTDFFTAGNLTIYYSPRQRKSEDFRGPDFFVVLETERKPRKSWIVSEEGKYPNVVVEILSDTTADTDRGLKKQIYQDIWRTPDYFWFDPDTLEFQGFELVAGQYQNLQPTAQGWLWSQQLRLYLGIQSQQLRFFTPEGQLVLTPQEQAEQKMSRAERLAAKLRDMGIDPDEV